jgi:hypothetical protein
MRHAQAWVLQLTAGVLHMVVVSDRRLLNVENPV